MASGSKHDYELIADKLRSQIAAGAYGPRKRLPTQRELAQEHGVSRDTVIRALSVLRAEGLIETHQGSGALVKEGLDLVSEKAPMVLLKPYVAEAFEATEVTLDVFSMTTESLVRTVAEQKDRIVAKEIRPPRSITARLLLPDTRANLAIPVSVEDPSDPRPRARLRRILVGHATTLRDTLHLLRDLDLVPEVSVQVRTVSQSPQMKLYVLNRRLALHGLYTPEKRPVTLDDGEVIEIIDSLGLGATMYPYRASAGSPPDQVGFVGMVQKWFENTWNTPTLSKEADF
ncbi:GntR family transcriptional regulator [Streptomyces sannanensis]|uniref:GntR family transcriptional regulator n=1 Tax=Streptomyces sannanensis TaxID=285536 RepID=A0ABP6SC61_9ACTN